MILSGRNDLWCQLENLSESLWGLQNQLWIMASNMNHGFDRKLASGLGFICSRD
jgi:hypothetical protein